jgi:hypothetical protein
MPDMNLASQILTGRKPAAEAFRKPHLYDQLNAGANGRLPFLGSSSKIEHGESVGILSTVLYMQPANESGREACAWRSPGCSAACLAEGTGRMSMSGPRQARRRRHASFYADRARFLTDLAGEIAAHAKKAHKLGKVAAVRLNGTTDFPWHRLRVTYNGTEYPNIHAIFPDVHFYEYTKIPLAIQSRGGLPSNLHLTFSISERADADAYASEYLRAGFGAAVVTFTKRHIIPESFKLGRKRYQTTDGDAHDARFLDPSGSIVILSAKGRAKTDESGFVRATN